MKMYRCVPLLVLSFLVALAAVAQEEEKPKPYVYGTYMNCETGAQWMVDAVVEEVYKPVYDKAVEDGLISGWGWLAHHTGGQWRRLLYHAAPSLEAMLDAQEAIFAKIRETNPQAAAALAQACPSHDDYIWQAVRGSDTATRGPAVFSVYYVCDMSQEERVDELVEQTFGPIYDASLGEGKLTSWGWLQHIVGGKYRRLLTMSAADFKTLLKTRAAMIEKLQAIDKETKEFSSICKSHQDYMWEIEHEK